MVWDAWMHQILWLHALMERQRRSPRESVLVEERRPARKRALWRREGRHGQQQTR